MDVSRVARLAFPVTLAGLAMSCSGRGPTPDAGTDAGLSDCAVSADCPNTRLFFCNTDTATCQPGCFNRSDCTAEVRGPYALPHCAGGRGCECDEGLCVAALCSADSQCEPQVCRNGRCVQPPGTPAVASCQVFPDVAVLRLGSKATFSVSSRDSAGLPVVIREGATWAALGAGPLAGSGSGHRVELTAAAVTSGSAPVDAVEAAFGSVRCRAKVLVLPSSVPTGQVGAVVVDELTGRPIPGVKLMVSRPDGGVVQQGPTPCVNGSGGCTVDTGPQGYAAASLGNPVAGTYSMTAFHEGYGYVTVANYTPPDAGANFLHFALRRNQTDQYGGLRGTFRGVPASPNVHAGVASMSVAGSITNLSLDQLLGPSVFTQVRIGPIDAGANLPAGIFLGFSDTRVKPDISAMGLAGVCTDGGVPDEARIAEGRCGTRAAWAFSGDMALNDLPLEALLGGASSIDVTKVLGQVIPLLKKLSSSVVRDVEFNLAPTPCVLGGREVGCDTPQAVRDFTKTSHFTPVDLEFAQVPLAFGFATRPGLLPIYRGARASGAVVLGAAQVRGRGLVPLGVGMGVNTAPAEDGLIDRQGDLPEAGLIGVRMAPTHHGLEGAEYGLLAIAVAARSLRDVTDGIATSAIFARLPNNALIFDPGGTTPVDLSRHPFPPFPEGAKYQYLEASSEIPARTFRLSSPVTGTQVVQFGFSDRLGRRWDVLVDGPGAAAGVTLPLPPATMADRTFSDSTASVRSSLGVQAFRLNAAPAASSGPAVSFEDLVQFNDTNADRLTEFLTGFSFVNYGSPRVAFTSPDSSPASVSRGHHLVVQVRSFRVSDDGVVRFVFTGSGGAPVGACPDTTVRREVEPGKVELVLEGTCFGSAASPLAVNVKATVMVPDGSRALAPEVSSTVALSIGP